MAIEVDLQVAIDDPRIPDSVRFETWVRQAIEEREAAELTVRVVGRDESASLNQRYRSRSGPTNVLSFASELPQELGLSLLGDVVICAPLVFEEAAEQGKDPLAHWAHLVVHGVLHLRGHDHQEEADAKRMESLETHILAKLGFEDPYT